MGEKSTLGVAIGNSWGKERNNPTAAIGDYRTHGTNPGRVGLNLSVGAQHQLSEDWSVNASYSLELMENSTSHSLNVGASYSF